MISYQEAMARIAALPVRSRPEALPLGQALGRVLAQGVVLPRDQPPFDRATMDGYAVAVPPAGRSFPVQARVVGEVRAGSSWQGALQLGEAVRIITGAPCPAGTTVVPIERTSLVEGPEDGQQVRCEASALAHGRNIAWRGEDGVAGSLVAMPGTLITPSVAALLGMCGLASVLVEPMPRIAVITTGDEVGSGGDAGIGDSNGPFLAGFAQVLRCPLQRQHVRDERSALRTAIAQAAEDADLLVTTGGVSASAADLVPEAALACGFMEVFHHVAIQPGKPVLVARHPNGCLMAGLPGNPVSVVATAHLFLLPLLGRLLCGWSWSWWHLPIANDRTGASRHQFLPARLGSRGVEVIPWNGSGDLLAAAGADGLVELLPGVSITAGTPVRFLPYIGSSAGGVGIIPPRPPASR